MNYYTEKDIHKLKEISKVLKREAMEMIYKAKAGHPGASLSEVEIITVLYFHVLNIDPNKPTDINRDRFILSKGHGSPTLYAALANRGFFSKNELKKFRKYNSILTSYPDLKTPGIDMVSGSLGHGLSVGAGMAKMSKLRKINNTIYVLLGDGELQEGLVWEAAMFSSHHNLDNLVAIVDSNGIQINGWVNNILSIDPLADKWKSFGWCVIEIDGHSIKQILDVFHQARKYCKPTVIICHTVKGKGVSFMEDNFRWHVGFPTDSEYKKLIEEFEEGGEYGE